MLRHAESVASTEIVAWILHPRRGDFCSGYLNTALISDKKVGSKVISFVWRSPLIEVLGYRNKCIDCFEFWGRHM